jgi:triosephosphate isomerase
MVSETGARAVIIGHSERRHVFGENDAMINKKIHAALTAGLMPIFCIGELIEEREAGNTNTVIDRMLRKGLEGVSYESAEYLVVAYEPVWAIGTGRTATPDIAQEAHAFVRSTIADIFDNTIADGMRILYGGSVKPSNIAGLMAMGDIDGVLVGGASLEPDSFAAIINH